MSLMPSNSSASCHPSSAATRHAVDLIRKAIALNPSAAVYHGNLGLALHKLDRLDEAIASFQTALDLGSADPNILTNFADTSCANGKTRSLACHLSASA